MNMERNDEIGIVQLRTGDIQGYLEEMINMDLAEQFEEDAYYYLMETGKISRSNLMKITNKYKDFYNQKF